MKLAIFAVVAMCVNGQGLTPREKPTDYPAHAEFGDGYILAADYLVHTLPTKDGAGLVANDYLVIEVAAYGPKLSKIDLSLGTFTLVLNKKTELTAESAGTVAASIIYPDRRQKPRVDLASGAGNATVVYSGQPQVQHFPGDPSVRAPRPNPVPAENTAGIEKEQPIPIEQRVQAVALGPGETPTTFAGLVFFPFPGKTKSIKTLELVYEGPQGKVTLKLE